MQRRRAPGSFPRDAGHRSPRESARHDQVEVRQVGIDVQGETVHRHPPRDPDADRRDLASPLAVPVIRPTADPDPRGARIPSRRDPETSERVDDRLLQEPNPLMDPDPESVEVHDRIDDQLTWTVVGDVSSSVGLVALDAMPSQRSLIRQDVSRSPWTPGHRDHWRIVLEQEKVPRGVFFTPSRDHIRLKSLLEVQRLRVTDSSKVLDLQPCRARRPGFGRIWRHVGGHRSTVCGIGREDVQAHPGP